MKIIDFLSFVDELIANGGVLSSSVASVTEKIDGGGIRLGIDDSGEFFFESTRSGPIYRRNSFSKFTANKFGKATAISKAYDKALDFLLDDPRIKDAFQKVGHKIIIKGEVLINDLAKRKDGKLRFVATDYDEENLGTECTFVLFDAPQETMKELIKLSTKEVKFCDSSIEMKPIDFSDEISQLSKNNLEEIQRKMEQKIAKCLPKSNLGQSIEGIVVKTHKHSFKVVSKKFRNEKTKEDKKWAETCE